MSRVGSIGRTFQIGQKQEWFIQFVFLGKIEDSPVQSNENWNLNKTGQTTSKRVDIVGLVKFGNLLIHNFGVAFVFRLNCFDGRL